MFLIPRSHYNGRAIVKILCAIVILFILWSLFIPSITCGPVNSPGIRPLSNTKQLFLALQQYASDHAEIKNDRSKYPEELHQLVTEGYLSESDYSKLTKNIDISYFPPNTEFPSHNHLLIVAHIPKYAIYVPISGKLELRKIP